MIQLGAGNDAEPAAQSATDISSAVAFGWWVTAFVAVIIVARLIGRKVRTNVYFREDIIMAVALIPLFIRMALIHAVLVYGTNNVDIRGLNPSDVHDRVRGSQLVLAARIFFAMFIWLSKWTISESLKRVISSSIWCHSYETTLRFIRIFLLVSFIAVVISTLGECQPFDHYWQIVPSPGASCQRGYAQLINMGVCEIISDLLLIALPLTLVLRSGMPALRKTSLVSLFSLSVMLVIITATRVPEVIKHLGAQRYRTMWASCEILAAALVSNVIVIGSFIRDRGLKRNMYQYRNDVDSLERKGQQFPNCGSMDSDENLFAAIGCRMPSSLRTGSADESFQAARPAPIQKVSEDRRDSHWTESGSDEKSAPSSSGSPRALSPMLGGRRLASFDFRRTSPHYNVPQSAILERTPALADVGGLLGHHRSHTVSLPTTPAAARRGRSTSLTSSPSPQALRPAPIQMASPPLAEDPVRLAPAHVPRLSRPVPPARGPSRMVINDAGGLLR